MTNVSIPKGTRDFGPGQMAARNYIFDTIKSVFSLFGYSQIETPAMENLSTLLGKYGDEGDKLLFRILNSGDPFTGTDFASFRAEDGSYNAPLLSKQLCDRGLRYDLTVPFARYVVQHKNDLAFPFRRFQIQPVWRADRPQKGRYREFYQCDADVIGTPSQLCELELLQMVDMVFSRFGVRVLIKFNNRKVLTGLAEICGFPDKVVDITVAIDKIDKVGLDAVKAELLERGLTPGAVDVIEPVISFKGDTAAKVAFLKPLMAGGSKSGITSEAGLLGIEEIGQLLSLVGGAGFVNPVELDLSLARGLNYYTGAIFEVKALDFAIGSICGGGRYDNLTGIFGVPGLSGVGISFGADRIYDVLEGLGKFPAAVSSGAKVLIANMDETLAQYLTKVSSVLRGAGVSCEVYPDSGKLKKQFDYAARKEIPFISINGTDERDAGVIGLKNLATGEQKQFSVSEINAIRDFLDA